MKIRLHCGEGVSREEGQIAICALAEIGVLLPKVSDDRFHIRDFGNWSQGIGPFQSLEWYENSSYIPEIDKFNGSNILLNFILEPWKKGDPHFDIAIFSKRMTAKDCDGNWLSFIFGLAGSGAAIISTHEFNHGLKNKRLRHLCLRRGVLHEFFHILGLVPDSRKTNIDNRLGLHCSNICVMRQGMSLSEWKNYAVEEEEKKVILCHQCKKDLHEVLSRK